MQENNTIIGAIRSFLIGCPLLDEGKRINVNYIGESMEYSVDPLPCQPVLNKYTDGAKKKQFQFAFTSKDYFDQDTRINIENSGFYQEFQEWLEVCNMNDHLPQLPGGKQYAVEFETLNSGFLYDADETSGKYRIECRLIYEQEA